MRRTTYIKYDGRSRNNYRLHFPLMGKEISVFYIYKLFYKEKPPPQLADIFLNCIHDKYVLSMSNIFSHTIVFGRIVCSRVVQIAKKSKPRAPEREAKNLDLIRTLSKNGNVHTA